MGRILTKCPFDRGAKHLENMLMGYHDIPELSEALEKYLKEEGMVITDVYEF